VRTSTWPRAAVALAATACLLLAGSSTASARVTMGFVAGPHASAETLMRIRASHADYVREKFSWAESEPSRGVFNWASTDADMAAASTAKIPILAVLAQAPGWAIAPGTPRGRQDTYPTRTADFTNWAGKLARRYGPNGQFWKDNPNLTPRPIHTWQVWNEPNIASEWTGGVASPTRYADLLSKTRDAIRAFDPSASFEAAGVAASGSAGSTPPSTFLKGVWRQLGASRSTLYKWDLHAYSDTAAHATDLIPYMRKLMDSNGCRGCTITVGEYGWASGARVTQRFGWLCAGSERSQATVTRDFLKATLKAAAANRLVELTWYRWDDPAPNSGATGCFRSLGVVDFSGRAKPALAVFESFAA